jgi:small subunit ribosomal protein S27Ae
VGARTTSAVWYTNPSPITWERRNRLTSRRVILASYFILSIYMLFYILAFHYIKIILWVNMAEEKKPPEKEEKKKKERKGKRVRTGRKHSRVDLSKLYSLEGGKIARKRKFCPRCGPGAFLAKNPGREYCGRCGYTEFDKQQK